MCGIANHPEGMSVGVGVELVLRVLDELEAAGAHRTVARGTDAGRYQLVTPFDEEHDRAAEAEQQDSVRRGDGRAIGAA